MINPTYIFFLIFFHIIKNVYSQEPSYTYSFIFPAIGETACEIYDINDNNCENQGITIEDLPPHCSSFLYVGFIVDNGILIDARSSFLDDLLQSRKETKVLIYYSHGSQMEWCKAVSADGAGQAKEMDNLKASLVERPEISGIILSRLLDLDAEVTAIDCPNYSQNLKTYIDFMRKNFPNLDIGIVISSKRAREWYNSPTLAWLDYTVLDTSVSFYVIDFQDLNKCSDEFTKTGCYPVSGNSNNTVGAIKAFLDNVGIQSTIVHYSFNSYAETKDESRVCSVNPINYCLNTADAKTSLCMDTLQTLYDKGVFARNNSAGFVLNAVNFDDSNSSCQCGQSFPAFNALFNGYMGNPPPQPCALFDRT